MPISIFGFWGGRSKEERETLTVDFPSSHRCNNLRAKGISSSDISETYAILGMGERARYKVGRKKVEAKEEEEKLKKIRYLKFICFVYGKITRRCWDFS